MDESPLNSESGAAVNRMRRLELGVAAAVAVSLLAAIIAVNLAAQRHGAGISTDSLRYLQGTRTLLDGHGFSWPMVSGTRVVYRPVTWWPPGYSLLLVGVSVVTGLDADEAAAALNTLLVALAATTIGLITFDASRGLRRDLAGKRRRSPWPAVVAVLLFGVSVDLMQVFAQAWSEPPFIVATLLCLWAVSRHVEKPRLGLLIAAGVLAGASYWIRYAGIVVLAHACLATFVLDRRPGWRPRLGSTAIVSAVGGALVAILVVRNQYVGDAGIGREPVVVTYESTLATLRSVQDDLGRAISLHAVPAGDFFDPAQSPSLLRTGLPLAALALAIGWVVARRAWKRDESAEPSNTPTAVPAVFLSFIVVYLAFLAFVKVALDPKCVLNWRLVAPAHAVGLVGLVVLAAVGVQRARRWGAVGAMAMATAVALIVVLAGAWADATASVVEERWQVEQAREPRRDRWPAAAWAYDHLPSHTWILTNERADQALSARGPWFVMNPPQRSASPGRLEGYSRRLRESGGAVIWWHMWRKYDELWAAELAEALDLVPLPGSETWPADVLVPRESVDDYPPGTAIGAGKQGVGDPSPGASTQPGTP